MSTLTESSTPGAVGVSSKEFAWITTFLREQTGIELKEGKQSLVTGRLDRRLRHHGFTSYREYFDFISLPTSTEERSLAIDLMTTNETSFFREQHHFDRLADLLPVGVPRSCPYRIWSAASSTGEEAYSIALTLADRAGDHPWEILGTDISNRVLETARRALYPLEAATRIPQDLLSKHCLKGRDQHEGLFTVQSTIRSRVSFVHANLIEPLPEIGEFDVVFLRNVMIYFSPDTKRQLIERISKVLQPGGHLLIGHAETLSGLDTKLELVSPSIYRMPAN